MDENGNVEDHMKKLDESAGEHFPDVFINAPTRGVILQRGSFDTNLQPSQWLNDDNLAGRKPNQPLESAHKTRELSSSPLSLPYEQNTSEMPFSIPYLIRPPNELTLEVSYCDERPGKSGYLSKPIGGFPNNRYKQRAGSCKTAEPSPSDTSQMPSLVAFRSYPIINLSNSPFPAQEIVLLRRHSLNRRERQASGDNNSSANFSAMPDLSKRSPCRSGDSFPVAVTVEPHNYELVRLNEDIEDNEQPSSSTMDAKSRTEEDLQQTAQQLQYDERNQLDLLPDSQLSKCRSRSPRELHKLRHEQSNEYISASIDEDSSQSRPLLDKINGNLTSQTTPVNISSSGKRSRSINNNVTTTDV